MFWLVAGFCRGRLWLKSPKVSTATLAVIFSDVDEVFFLAYSLVDEKIWTCWYRSNLCSLFLTFSKFDLVLFKKKNWKILKKTWTFAIFFRKN